MPRSAVLTVELKPPAGAVAQAGEGAEVNLAGGEGRVRSWAQGGVGEGGGHTAGRTLLDAADPGG